MGENLGGVRRPWLWRASALLALAAFYYAVPNARLDFTRFNCHDSESYLALSYSLTHGRGYTRSLPPGRYVSHEMWPPGLPLLLAPATAGADGALDWARVKRTMATVGLLGLVPLWLWVRRLGGAGAADAAALVVALNPLYWHFSHQAMAELPLFLWLVAGLWLIDRTWSQPRLSWRTAALVGLACGLGMLVKGHAAGLALAPLAYLGTTAPRRSPTSRLGHWLIFGLAFTLPYGLWFARNQTVDAPGLDGASHFRQLQIEDPNDPSSPERGLGESIGAMATNLRRYAIYHLPAQVVPALWPAGIFDWRGSGWLALALTLLLLAAAYRARRGIRAALLVAAFAGALNLLYGYGGSPRYWVPVSLLLLTLITMRFAAAAGRLSPGVRSLVAVGGALALAVNLGAYVAANERAPYNPNGPWAELAELFERARDSGLESAGVLTPNSHAFQLMSGLPAPMAAAESTFEHLVARLDGHGQQPPPGSRLLLEVAPWGLFELPAPTAGAVLTGGGPPRYPMEW